MLYLKPPFLQINGLTLLPDHIDPAAWYYLPMGPRLVTRQNATGQLLPAFDLIRFKKAGAPNGGFLNFDVQLGVDQPVLDDTAKQVGAQMHLPKVTLSPVQLEGGSVRLIILGHESGEAGNTNARFVQKISQPASPSLFGTNEAAFSVQLDEDGATMIDKTLGGEILPIGVVYSLDYLALRPAYSVRLNIDWDRVQQRLASSFKTGSLFVSGEINDVVDKLVDDRAIDMQVDTFVVADDTNKDVIKDLNQAKTAVYEMITDAFFTASINPTQKEPDGWDKAAAIFTSLQPASVVGGLLPHYSYNNAHFERIDKKRLNVTMEERSAVKRSIFPQGHLAGLAAAIKESGQPLSTFVMDVNLDDDWFKRRRMRVIPRIDFASGHVVSAAVDLRYNNVLNTALFSADKVDATDVDWTSVVTEGQMVMPVQAKTRLNLTQVDDIARPNHLEGPEQTVEGEVLEVFSADFFTLKSIPVITTSDLPWDRYSGVEVTIRYADPAHEIRQESTFELSRTVPAWNYVVYTVDPEPASIDYRLRYKGIGRPDVELDWATTDEEQIHIRDPFPSKRDLLVVPLVSWQDVVEVLVDLVYEDHLNGVRLERTLDFTAQGSQLFSVDLRDPARRVVSYGAVFLFKDGHQVTIPQSQTIEPRLLVGPTSSPHRVVTVSVDMSAADAADIESVVVGLTAGSPPAAANGNIRELTFRPGSTPASFEFDFKDTPMFSYRMIYKHNNGTTKTVDWVASQDAELALGIN